MTECINPAQSDAGHSPKSSPVHSPVMLPPCRICSEKASGFHYGVNTCEACKGFFRRSLKKKTQYKCAYDSECGTQSIRRNMCAACRYKKCIDVGMSKSAIKTGRYTHKKKTENIREVKQLERGHQPDIGPELPHDMGALVPKLPLWITENKHEIVIDYILSAFEDQEQTLQVVNIFENTCIKDIEETFLENRSLYGDVFGSLKPIPVEEYMNIYQSTGLDIDGRRELIERMIPRYEAGVRRCIAFLKTLPGFQTLPLEDQMELVSNSRYDLFTMLSHKNLNREHRLMTFFWGETVEMDRLGSSTLDSPAFIDALLTISSRIQKLDLCRTETIILCCIALFFTDRCNLKCPEKVEESQQLLIDAFSYLLKKKHPDDPVRLAQCLLLFPEMRSLARLFSAEEDNFADIWVDKVKLPPLLVYEYWSV